eukprot:gnl/MRDRNA2_/MRDRNA2_105578_c0_seq1.p1 gnl/MRDRNA2_/MRDRNA2_105578_c0~~gnl/MRDRNA2_/MRDRNA2_105578_c0_seq1.p1  ORF type:complete len:703 (+),score=122.78 gnl/MRDRNA2_/MRDRNA2_105578_c0_seq1:243-2351(+)
MAKIVPEKADAYEAVIMQETVRSRSRTLSLRTANIKEKDIKLRKVKKQWIHGVVGVEDQKSTLPRKRIVAHVAIGAVAFTLSAFAPPLVLLAWILAVAIPVDLYFVMGERRGIHKFVKHLRNRRSDKAAEIKERRYLILTDRMHLVFFVKSLIDLAVSAFGWYHETLKFKLINEEGPPENTWWCWSAGPGNSTHWNATEEGCLVSCGMSRGFCNNFSCLQQNDQHKNAHWLLLLAALNAWAPLVSYTLAVVMARPLSCWAALPNLLSGSVVIVFTIWPSGCGVWPATGSGPGVPDSEERRLSDAALASMWYGLISVLVGFRLAKLFPMCTYEPHSKIVFPSQQQLQEHVTEAKTDLQEFFDNPDEAFMEFRSQFIAPMHVRFSDKIDKLLGQPIVIVQDKAVFVELVREGYRFMCEFLNEAKKFWTPVILEGVSTGGCAQSYSTAYHAVHELIRIREPTVYGNFAGLCENAMHNKCAYQGLLDGVEDRAERLFATYEAANKFLKYFFRPLMNSLKDLGEVQCAPLKSLSRVLEKELLRPDAGVPWDIVRGMVRCDAMQDVTIVLRMILNMPGVQLIHLNDRFSNSKGGWADCALYISSSNPQFKGVVAEIQIVHNDLMLVRENMGAHDIYDKCRFAAEFLQKEYKSQEKSAVVEVLKPSTCAVCGLLCANCHGRAAACKVALPYSVKSVIATIKVQKILGGS